MDVSNINAAALKSCICRHCMDNNHSESQSSPPRSIYTIKFIFRHLPLHFFQCRCLHAVLSALWSFHSSIYCLANKTRFRLSSSETKMIRRSVRLNTPPQKKKSCDYLLRNMSCIGLGLCYGCLCKQQHFRLN